MNPPSTLPRLVIAGLSGGSGKTIVSMGLLLAAQRRGLSVRAFKKGPDYIDAAWLAWASRGAVHNLDTYLMGHKAVVASFTSHAVPGGLNLIEGNRGLYDGVDAAGTHSTAVLSKALGAPVVLVLDATKVTRTAAAMVLGCQRLDPDVNVAGVILNRVSGPRHERVLREAIEISCGIPVLGAIPRIPEASLLPERHLGLVLPDEHPGTEPLRRTLEVLLEGRLAFERLWELSCLGPDLYPTVKSEPDLNEGKGLRIGHIRDSAFTFYYPENLEMLKSAGATLVPISALSAASLPDDLDALYIGGGFPETHGKALSANKPFLAALWRAVDGGLPVYAECGGLMLLSRAIVWKTLKFRMAGILPFEVEVCPKPQGHGYTELVVDTPNPFFPEGTTLKGHEFHYSRILPGSDQPNTACAVRRGVGCCHDRDGVIVGNSWASYTHLHALATPEWTQGLLNAARRFAKQKAETRRQNVQRTPAF
ncbi:Cobyrinic acid A,C-diamide synthase [Acidobacteriia bacterium SbA2]|nr:Cobyrinic acid A,C-diamide synthase [Acidobacteriia bacterium SbA2]